MIPSFMLRESQFHRDPVHRWRRKCGIRHFRSCRCHSGNLNLRNVCVDYWNSYEAMKPLGLMELWVLLRVIRKCCCTAYPEMITINGSTQFGTTCSKYRECGSTRTKGAICLAGNNPSTPNWIRSVGLIFPQSPAVLRRGDSTARLVGSRALTG